MIKFVSIFTLAEGSNHDKLWKYWKEVHAANARKMPGIKKYVINRVITPIAGDNEFWGLAEIWFDDMEAYRQYLVTRPKDDYWLSFYQPLFSTWVEEKEID